MHVPRQHPNQESGAHLLQYRSHTMAAPVAFSWDLGRASAASASATASSWSGAGKPWKAWTPAAAAMRQTSASTFWSVEQQ